MCMRSFSSEHIIGTWMQLVILILIKRLIESCAYWRVEIVDQSQTVSGFLFERLWREEKLERLEPSAWIRTYDMLPFGALYSSMNQ